MKKAIRSFLALAMTLGLTIALAAPAQAAWVTHSKEVSGSAFWHMYDDAAGIYTNVDVYASDGVFRSPSGDPGSFRSVSISISQFRYEGDDYVPVRDISFWGDIPAGCLVVSQNLTSASLIVSGLQGTQWDYETETETPVTIGLNVSWTANGPLSNYTYNYHWRYPSEFVYNRGTGKSREGSAVGILSLDGFDIVLEAGDVDAGEEAYASINSTKGGHVASD